MTAVRWIVVLMLLAGGGCARPEPTVELKPAFSNDTVVGQLKPTWTASGDARDTDSGRQRRFILRVDAVNELADPLYLRLSNLRLVGPAGPIQADGARAECALAPGTTERVLHAVVWAPVANPDDIRGVEVDYFAVPLSQRGRAFYREFLLQQRPGDAAAIDAEIVTYAAAPLCAAAGKAEG